MLQESIVDVFVKFQRGVRVSTWLVRTKAASDSWILDTAGGICRFCLFARGLSTVSQRKTYGTVQQICRKIRGGQSGQSHQTDSGASKN